MTRLSAADVENRARGICLVRGVDRVPRRHLRLETIFRYPDGGAIDLFIPWNDDLFAPVTVTDFGQTMTWLADNQVRPWTSKKRQQFLADALLALGVEQDGGAFVTTVNPDLSDLTEAIARVGQACIRAADLMFTSRSVMQSSITEDVEELLIEHGLRYTTNAVLEGPYGEHRFNFLVEGQNQRTAVLTWSSAHPSSAHNSSLEILVKWYDLITRDRPEQRLTVWDDRSDVYKPEDIERLEGLSTVLPISRPDEVVAVLRA
jgi:hypothetical protein